MTQQMRTLPAGTVLFAGCNDDQGIKSAQEYARFHQFTKDCIKIKRIGEQVLVIAQVPVETKVAIMSDGSFFDHIEQKEQSNGH